MIYLFFYLSVGGWLGGWVGRYTTRERGREIGIDIQLERGLGRGRDAGKLKKKFKDDNLQNARRRKPGNKYLEIFCRQPCNKYLVT